MKSKQFGQELRKLCKEEVVVATIGFYGCDHISMQKETMQQICNVVMTIEDRVNIYSVWS